MLHSVPPTSWVVEVPSSPVQVTDQVSGRVPLNSHWTVTLSVEISLTSKELSSVYSMVVKVQVVVPESWSPSPRVMVAVYSVAGVSPSTVTGLDTSEAVAETGSPVAP